MLDELVVKLIVRTRQCRNEDFGRYGRIVNREEVGSKTVGHDVGCCDGGDGRRAVQVVGQQRKKVPPLEKTGRIRVSVPRCQSFLRCRFVGGACVSDCIRQFTRSRG